MPMLEWIKRLFENYGKVFLFVVFVPLKFCVLENILDQEYLRNCLIEILNNYPEGKSEYALFSLLQKAPYEVFNVNALSEPLSLFQSHFILFHCLYQLRTQYRTTKFVDIQINATCIKLLPYRVAEGAIARLDKLQDYYLDWQNFAQTDRDDVRDLLESFWRRMSREKTCTIKNEQIVGAYKAFDLPFDSQLNEVKARYRKLQHIHHPDKGGEHHRAQYYEKQFSILKLYLDSKAS